MSERLQLADLREETTGNIDLMRKGRERSRELLSDHIDRAVE
jgi:hypothetical protein